MLIWIQQFFMQVLIWLLALVDSIFGVFAAIGGIEKVNVNAGDGEMTLSSYFLQLDGVQRAFWIIFIASIGICAVCTVIAIIKNIINAKGGEPKSHVRTLGQSLSSTVVALFMAMLLVVGVGCAEELLGAVNTELNGGEMQTMSANIIDVSLGRSPLYDTNNLQGLNDYDEETGEIKYISYLYRFERDTDGKPKYYPVDNAEEKHVLKYIDPTTGVAFDNWTYVFNEQNGEYKPILEKLEVAYDKSGWIDPYDKTSLKKDILDESVRSIFGTYETNWIGWPEYWKQNGKINPDSFNFVVAYLTTVIIAIALISAAFGLVKRLFDIVLLFIALPGITATIPLDDGAKFKLWRETVISKIFLAFGSVLAVNVFFIVAPSLWNVSIPGANVLTNALLKVFLICGGALTISGGQLLFARLLGTSAEESREMGQSARTLMGGVMGGLGMAKALGRGVFGYRNANGQRVGGLIKGATGAVGSVGGGAINAVGGAIGGQAYKNSKFGKGVTATQSALKGFGSSAGWLGGGSKENPNLGYGLSKGVVKLGGIVGRRGAVQRTGLNNGIVGGIKTAATAPSRHRREQTRQQMQTASAAFKAADAELTAKSQIPVATGREVLPGFDDAQE